MAKPIQNKFRIVFDTLRHRLIDLADWNLVHHRDTMCYRNMPNLIIFAVLMEFVRWKCLILHKRVIKLGLYLTLSGMYLCKLLSIKLYDKKNAVLTQLKLNECSKRSKKARKIRKCWTNEECYFANLASKKKIFSLKIMYLIK